MALIPVEYAWIIPIVVPLVIGLISGVIIKKALKLILVIVLLIIVLAIVGYIQYPSTESFLRNALTYLPLIQEKAGPLLNILPYTTVSFVIGLILGLWKG